LLWLCSALLQGIVLSAANGIVALLAKTVADQLEACTVQTCRRVALNHNRAAQQEAQGATAAAQHSTPAPSHQQQQQGQPPL
jgi:hypothetical protein